MPYTEDQIQKMAKQMASAGAPQGDVEQFISLARQESVQSEVQTKDLPIGRDAVVANAVEAASGSVPTTDSELVQGLKATGSMIRAAGYPAIGGAVGKGLGAMTGVAAPVAIPVLGGIGSAIGDVLAQQQEGGPYSLGRTAGQAVLGAFSPTAAPGASMQTLGRFLPQTVPLHAQAAKYAMAGMTAKAAETMLDRGEAPTAEELALSGAGGAIGAKFERMAQAPVSSAKVERMVNDAATNATVKEWLNKGGKIDPTLTYRESFLNRGLSKVAGGSTEIQRAANEVNQPLVNKLVREDIRFPANAPLDELHIRDHITKLSAPFREIENVSPKMKGLIDDHRSAREEAVRLWDSYKGKAEGGKPDTDLRKAAIAATEAADKAAEKIGTALKEADREDLLNEFNVAKRLLAKTYQARSALTGGNISAEVLDMMRDKQRRNMDGNMELVARFRAEMPKVMRDIRDIQPVGDVGFSPLVSRLGTGLATAAGAQTLGAAPAATAGIGAAGAMLAPAAARGIMANPIYQRVMAAPRYGVEDPQFQQNLMRMLAMSAGQR